MAGCHEPLMEDTEAASAAEAELPGLPAACPQPGSTEGIDMRFVQVDFQTY